MRTNQIPVLLVACMLIIPAALPGQLQGVEKSADEYITPVVSHRQFARVVQQLDVQSEQRMILEVAFEEYLESVADTYQQADKAADEAGRRIVLDALSGRRVVDLDEFRQRRLAVLEVYASYQQDADVHIDILLSNVRSVLTDDQRPALALPERRLRRELYLHPLHAGRHAYEYAGEGVDVIRLIEDAMRAGGELELIDDELLADVRNNYEHELDSLLTEYGPAIRRVHMNERIARIAQEEEARRDAEREAIALWKRLYDLNQKTVAKIGETVATEIDRNAAERWAMRFDKACFPWLFSRQLPDRQYEWITQQTLHRDQRQRIDDVYEHYRQMRREKCLDAIDLMLGARREHQRVIYPMMNPSRLQGQEQEIHRRLLRHSGVMAGLDASVSAELESLLSDHQRTALRRAVRPRRGR